MNCLKWKIRKSLSYVNQHVSSSGSWQLYKYIISLHFNQSTRSSFVFCFCFSFWMSIKNNTKWDLNFHKKNWWIISMWRGKWHDLTKFRNGMKLSWNIKKKDERKSMSEAEKWFLFWIFCLAWFVFNFFFFIFLSFDACCSCSSIDISPQFSFPSHVLFLSLFFLFFYDSFKIHLIDLELSFCERKFVAVDGIF